jgi:hypothetical protein
MYSYAALLIGDSAWMMGLPAVLFLWRRKGLPAGSTKNDRAKNEQRTARGDWLYVGRDEDGTPFYLDPENLTHESGNGVRVRMWVKFRPRKGSAAFLKAESLLGAAGKGHEQLGHIRQKLEMDFTKNMVSDLELVFHAPDGRSIESIKYNVPEWKKIAPGSLHELLLKTADGIWRPDRFPADPALGLKLREKLKEINEAFEAFETGGE